MYSKHNLLYLFIFIITICGCGSNTTPSADTNKGKGDIVFSLKWETPTSIPLNKGGEGVVNGEGLSYAPIDCTAIGVLTVTANVYDLNQTYLISGGPWDCTSHSGTITNVPAGDNRKITVYGKDSSDKIIYKGVVAGVTITVNQTTNAGSVTMSSIASDTTAPADGTLSAAAGSSQVSLRWSGFFDSGGIDYYKLVYSTSSTPSSCSSGAQIYLGSGTSYTHTGLTNSTTYYYRVCATDTAGNTSSGATTSGSPAPSSVTDIDGNVYNTVIIGTQVWMKENLKVTKYRNGDAIGTTTPLTKDISSETSPKYQWAYNGDESNVSTYGRLYTWYAVTDSRGVCPTGWHLPTNSEWTTLTDYLGGESVAGGKMKEAGTTHWSSPNTGADNSSGFTALPGGYRYYTGTFYSMGYHGFWWSATEFNSTDGWLSYLNYDYGHASRTDFNKSYGFSVRCVRD